MKRFAARLGVIALTAGTAATLPMLAGCQTLGDTQSQNEARVDHAVVTNWYQIGDDAESIMLLDRPVQMSVLPVPSQ
jgi:hypothetical protein